jgi:hypothetical protein
VRARPGRLMPFEKKCAAYFKALNPAWLEEFYLR